MSAVKKISIALTHDMAETVKSAVDNGEYGSTSEVIREALRTWHDERARKEAEIDMLRDAWSVGVKSGPGKFKDIDAIIAAARAK